MSVRPVISRYLRRAVITVVLVALSMGSVKLGQPPAYEATAQVLVEQGTRNGKIQLIPLAPAPETLRAITQTMTDTIDSRPVAEEAVQRLELKMSPAELLDNLTIEQDAGTSVIRLTYEDTDPERVRLIVNTVSEVSSERISPIRAVGSEFTATVWEKAAAPESPVSPTPLRNGLLTLVIGLVLCVALLLAPIHRSA